jgi:hypothetical protein
MEEISVLLNCLVTLGIKICYVSLAMNRWVRLLILGTLCLGIMGGRPVRFHHHPQKSATPHGGLYFSLYFPSDDPSGTLNEANQPLAPSRELAFFPKPCGPDLPAWDWANPASQRQENHQGLGCGGLPA